MANAQSEVQQLLPLVEFKESQYRVLAPTVGYYSAWPKPGAFLAGGCFIGTMKVLNKYYNLYLPEGCYGRVIVNEDRDIALAVEHGQELFRLNPDKDFSEPVEQINGAGTGAEDIDTSGGGYVVTAFTTGIFYAKPSPDAPPFVSEGQTVEKGKALGLIEVMKTFNHIIFHGTDKADTGVIKKVYVKDSQEVKLGQPLFLIE
jgi:acetyl-CoA carboxylase biotin carboxyl carrier protein